MSFFERKEYPLGNGNKAISYELVDDYQARVQFTPEQAETLLQWLNSKATQIRRDVMGEPLDELAAQWKHPHTVTIRLHNGQTIKTEVNGLAFDKKSGWIRLKDKDTTVALINGEWIEV